MMKYLMLSSSLFIIGLFGMLLSRKHLMMILMALELLLLAMNINFTVCSMYHDDIVGQIYTLLILAVGATESAIGLALLIVYYSLRSSISIELITHLKG